MGNEQSSQPGQPGVEEENLDLTRIYMSAMFKASHRYEPTYQMGEASIAIAAALGILGKQLQRIEDRLARIESALSALSYNR